MFKPIVAGVSLLCDTLHAEPTATIWYAGPIDAANAGSATGELQPHVMAPPNGMYHPRFTGEGTWLLAEQCHGFGIVVRFTGAVPVEVDVHLHHPAQRRPDGGAETDLLFIDHPLNGLLVLAYIFNERWEMVPGEWTWTVAAQGRTLASESFQITAPAKDASLPSPCQAQPTS